MALPEVERSPRFPLLIRGLLNPDAYPHPARDIQVCETHISWVILAGAYAYKVKKPIDMGFLDFSTLDRRIAAGEEELRLNRRLAPLIYLGLVDIVQQDGRIRIGGKGTLLEKAVLMRRLPAEGMLPELIATGMASAVLMRRIGRLVADFHRVAATGPGVDEHGSPDAISAICQENFRQIRPFVGDVIPLWQFNVIVEWSNDQLRQADALLRRREAASRVRECHGDLHAGNVCLVGHRIVLFDCLEFSPRYRCSDVAAEVAFLAMDLDHAGRPDLAWYFVDAYVKATADADLPKLLPFYKAYRACVRGKVTALRLQQDGLSSQQREDLAGDVRSYLDLACAHACGTGRPRVLVVGGLPGSGKTTLAKNLAGRLGMFHVSTDVVRKRLAGLEPTDSARAPYGTGIYDVASTRQTYRRLRRVAARWLARGVSVILDGSFGDPRQRALTRRLAHRAGADFHFVLVTCTDEERRSRLAARSRGIGVTSDADWEVAMRMARSFVEPIELDVSETIADPTGGSGADRIVEQLLR